MARQTKNYSQEITQRFLLLRDEVMHELAISQSQFGKRIGEYTQNFSLMEKGTRSPTLEQMARACEEFGYSANWLLLNHGPKKLDPSLNAPIEKRVSELEMQMLQIKKLMAKNKVSD